MNSYNDNLNSVVVASLQAQELENKQLNSQRIASMFTLYHAEGATINAYEKLEADEKTLKAKGVVLDQAVQNQNISTNLLASATQEAAYVAQSVTNTSVAAANTQIAGNAILKLAGDMGNVFSIVNAADFDTEIYNQGKQAMELINDTAYLAEVATQTAMNASIKTSEVSAATVLSKAKAANTQMTNLYQIVSTDFNNTLQTVLNDTTNLSSTSVAEKAAEGSYEDIVAEYKAARGVYKAINEQLNLGLNVRPVIQPKKSDPQQDLSQYVSQRKIQFDLIQSPFAYPWSADVPVPADVKLGGDANPVSEYYIILVNEKNRTTFSMTEAEAIILKGPGNYIKLNVVKSSLQPAAGSQTEQVFVPASLALVNGSTTTPVPVKNNNAIVTVDFFDVNGGKKLIDSEGKPVDMGTNYVVFILAVYDNSYKRKLNNFEDFLSATSNTFKLSYFLAPAFNVGVELITPDTEKEHADWYSVIGSDEEADQKAVKDTSEVTFSVSENPSYSGDVEYRCVILPKTHDVMHGLLTRSTLHDLEHEVTRLHEIADEFDPVIDESYNKMLNMRMSFERIGFTPTCQTTNPPTTSKQQAEYNAEYRDLLEKQKNANGEEKKLFSAMIKVMQSDFKRIGFIPDTKGGTPVLQTTSPATTAAQQATYNTGYNKVNDGYVTALEEKNKALKDIEHHTADNFSFIFNLRLAEQVSPGNYLLPTKYDVKENVTGYQYPVHKFIAPFGPEATDNFGNPLIPDHEYLVVVLSISIAPEQNLSTFVNNWTGDSPVVAHFKYTEPKKKEEAAIPETPATRIKKELKKIKPRKK